jgi:hemoglobin
MRKRSLLVLCGAIASAVLAAETMAQSATAPATKTPAATTTAPPTTTAPTAKSSLYERLGGEKTITAVVDDFVGRAAKDEKANFFRKNVPGVKEWKPTPEQLATFKHQLVQYVCMATGGPQKYEGATLKTLHETTQFTDAEFDALAKDLAASLDKLKVPKAEHDELMAIVAKTRANIVEKKATVAKK